MDTPSGATRPPMVTVAAVLLIIGGVLNVLGGLLLLGAGGEFGALLLVLGIIALVLGAVQIFAGVNVLQLKERGRRIGLVVAGAAILLQLLSITQTPVNSVIGILINGFVIYALTQHASHFRA